MFAFVFVRTFHRNQKGNPDGRDRSLPALLFSFLCFLLLSFRVQGERKRRNKHGKVSPAVPDGKGAGLGSRGPVGVREGPRTFAKICAEARDAPASPSPAATFLHSDCIRVYVIENIYNNIQIIVIYNICRRSVIANESSLVGTLSRNRKNSQPEGRGTRGNELIDAGSRVQIHTRIYNIRGYSPYEKDEKDENDRTKYRVKVKVKLKIKKE